jgi:hypothetical protein
MDEWKRAKNAKDFGLGLFVIERQRLGEEGSNLEAKMVGGLLRV